MGALIVSDEISGFGNKVTGKGCLSSRCSSGGCSRQPLDDERIPGDQDDYSGRLQRTIEVIKTIEPQGVGIMPVQGTPTPAYLSNGYKTAASENCPRPNAALNCCV